MVSGILWQLVDFDSASNELYPPVVSKITNIFKMFVLWEREAKPCWLCGLPPVEGAKCRTSLSEEGKRESGEECGSRHPQQRDQRGVCFSDTAGAQYGVGWKEKPE